MLSTFLMALALAPLALAQSSCPANQVSFEMVTGYVYTAPADMLDSQPGTLMLTECIDTCRRNESCKAINYETGLCVLFSSNADENDGQLTTSQFPVFTIYVQKTCLASSELCSAAWSFERVMNHRLDAEVKKRGQAENRMQCQQLCMAETDFKCRSAQFTASNGDCQLLAQDRHTLAGQPAFNPSDEEMDYMEINCNLDEPKKLCVYDRTMGKILKTVDSVYQAIASKEDCEDLCNNAPFRCHSYDYNDTGDNVCRLSHHSAHTLTQIEEPYLAIEEAATYSLSGCYNVTIECQSGDMTAHIHTTTAFNGKVYAKGSPVSCVVDVDDSLEFAIKMEYNDLECGVEREGPGVYSSEVIVQHHDRIVTSDDLGLSLTCQYDLTNKSVSNTVDLAITGEIAPALYEESVVDSPNVLMRVEDATNGENTKEAVVGDPLYMIFEIVDEENSPYEIFVRDLVAVDGATDTELLLIDSRGCPADPSIMSELRRRNGPDSKSLVSSFDAFRFPTSQMVQFRAMVTPCMPKCEPVQCDVIDYTGQGKSVDSYGRKKRSMIEGPRSALINLAQRTKRMAEPEEMLVIQTLRIVDKIGKRSKSQAPKTNDSSDDHEISDLDSFQSLSPDSSRCVDDTSLLAGGIIFIVLQVLLLVLWTLLWRKRRSEQAKQVVMTPETMSSTDSLSYIYETGIPRRLN